MPLNIDTMSEDIEDNTDQHIYQLTDDVGSVFWVRDVEEAEELLGDACISIRRYTLTEMTDIDLISLEPMHG